MDYPSKRCFSFGNILKSSKRSFTGDFDFFIYKKAKKSVSLWQRTNF